MSDTIEQRLERIERLLLIVVQSMADESVSESTLDDGGATPDRAASLDG